MCCLDRCVVSSFSRLALLTLLLGSLLLLGTVSYYAKFGAKKCVAWGHTGDYDGECPTMN